mgnify:CR=1 FL=1
MPGQTYWKTATFIGLCPDEWNNLPLEVHSTCHVDKFKSDVIKFLT